MSMYEEAFFRGRIGNGYASLLILAPKTKPKKVLLRNPSQDLFRVSARHPKKRQRALFLKSLFEAEGSKIGTLLLSEFCPSQELVTTRLGEGEKVVVYGVDGRGPFARTLEKRFLIRGKKQVRRSISFEELVLVYQGEDPDSLVNLIRNFIAETIRAIETALLAKRNEEV